MKIVKRILTAVLATMMTFVMAVPAFAAGTSTALVNMHEMESDYVTVEDDGITDSYGKTYSSNVLRFSTGDNAYITYDLNGAYETFDATIVCGDRTGSGATMSVGIYADGEKVYDLTGYTRQKAAETVSLDVSGVGELSIKTTKTDGYDGYLYFVNSTFTKADTAAVYPTRAELSDMVVIDSHYCEVSNRLLVDVFGDVHNGWARMNGGDEGYVLFNLDKKYVSLTGNIVTTDRTGNEAAINIEFYLDDKLVYSQEGVTRTSKPIAFNLDVTNASVLKITTSKTAGYDGYIYVTDSVLKAHEHTLSDWTVTKEATCTENGEQVQTCTVCGETVNTESIPATGHTADGKWVVEKEATCSEEGEEVQHCTVCKEVCDTRAIDKLDHTPASDWTVESEATCAKEGKEVKTCTVCGEVVEEQAIPTTDHTYGAWETVSGSIWNNPIVKERTCSVCGDVEHVENSPTTWLKPLIIVLFIIIFGGLAVICVTLKMNGLPLAPSSVKKLFSKESLSDEDIDDILNKHDENDNSDTK